MAGDVAANRVWVCAVLGADDFCRLINDLGLISNLKLLSLRRGDRVFLSHC